jgi:hypothetical protein
MPNAMRELILKVFTEQKNAKNLTDFENTYAKAYKLT